MKYLLDTNIVSSLYANPFGPAAERASRSDATELGTSIKHHRGSRVALRLSEEKFEAAGAPY